MFSLKTTVIEKWQFIFSELYCEILSSKEADISASPAWSSEMLLHSGPVSQSLTVVTQVTVLFGLYILIMIPSSPAEASFLSEEERVMALERIRSNKTGTAAEGIKTYQYFEALRDPRFYLCSLVVFSASVPNGGIRWGFVLSALHSFLQHELTGWYPQLLRFGNRQRIWLHY